MDYELGEEQQMLKKTARDFLEKECPKSLVREMEDDERGYPPELWRKMAELGWMRLVFPEEYGGMGGDFLDLTVLLEEMGRALLPAPFLSTVVCCGLPISDAGSEEQKQQFLPKIAKGEMILALALTEPSASYDASGVTVSALPDGEDYIINGTKLFVPDAAIADYLLCVTRTKDGKSKEDGITSFLVDGKDPGLNYTPLRTIALDKQYEIDFRNVRVPRRYMLGELDQGWPVIANVLAQAAIAECALMVGGAQQVLEMTVAYAKERVQFGRPIGSFQVIQHKCADMATDADSARYITYWAAWKLSKGLPFALEASIAKAWVSEAYRRICRHGQQIHGGIGIIKDHDMQLYFRRAKVAELTFGDAISHRELIAREMGWC